jgi:hypothetical protein
LICVLFGCDMPVILRREAPYSRFIGSCFVLGIMDGEAIGRLIRFGDIRSFYIK